MPSSTHKTLSNVLDVLKAIDPKTVLDVGIGYGKWGFLCREYLEAHADRVYPDDWKVKITGVEAWTPYIERIPWIGDLYDEIYPSRIEDLVSSLPDFELIIAGDVIEHLMKDDALMVLEELKKRTVKAFILSIPIGERWLGNMVIAGNDFESHRSTWSLEELNKIMGRPPIFKSEEPRGEVAVYVYTP